MSKSRTAMLAIVATALVALGWSGVAEAGGHGGSPSPSKTPCASHSPRPSASPSVSPSESPEPSETPSESPTPSATPDENDEGGKGGGGGEETTSPSPSATPDEGDTLPQTGASMAMGGLAGAGTIGYASYVYLRSKRRVVDALRKQK